MKSFINLFFLVKPASPFGNSPHQISRAISIHSIDVMKNSLGILHKTRGLTSWLFFLLTKKIVIESQYNIELCNSALELHSLDLKNRYLKLCYLNEL